MATTTPLPSPSSSSTTSTSTSTSTSTTDVFNNLISRGAIAGIALSVALTITLLAVLCCCCCCCHRRRRRRHSYTSRSRHPTVSKNSSLNSGSLSSTRRSRPLASNSNSNSAAAIEASELGLERDPASAMTIALEMDDYDDDAAAVVAVVAGRSRGGVVLEEPPPAYSTLEHRHPPPPPPPPPPMPATVAAESSRPAETRHAGGGGSENGQSLTGMEAWNGGGAPVIAGTSSGEPGGMGMGRMNPWMETTARVEEAQEAEEAPVAGPIVTGGGNRRSLRVNTNATPEIHVMDENGDEDEEAGLSLSRSMTYSASSVREAAFGTIAMPSIINNSRERAREEPKS